MGKIKNIEEEKIKEYVRMKLDDFYALEPNQQKLVEKRLLKGSKEDPISELQNIVPITLMVDHVADNIASSYFYWNSHLRWDLRCSEDELQKFVDSCYSKDVLMAHIRENKKLVCLKRKMPLSLKFKKDLAHNFFEKMGSDDEVINEVLKHPDHFDLDIIDIFYKTEEVLLKLEDSGDVFNYPGTGMIQNKRIEYIGKYGEIIDDLYKDRPDRIKPLVERLVVRISNGASKEDLKNFGDNVRQEYCRYSLINGIKISDENLEEFKQSTDNAEVMDLVKKRVVKDNSLRLESIGSMIQLMKASGGLSDDFRNALLEGINTKNENQSSDDSHRHRLFGRRVEANGSEGKVNCFYFCLAIDYLKTNSSQTDDKMEEIKKLVSEEELTKYLKSQNCDKDKRKSYLNEYKSMQCR